MRRYGDSPWCAKRRTALGNLAAKNAENKVTIAGKGGIDAGECMSATGTAPLVCEKASGAGHLAKQRQNNVTIAGKGGIDAVVEYMSHWDIPGCAKACRALLIWHPTLRTKSPSLGKGASTPWWSVEAPRGQPPGVRRACWALSNLVRQR